jgi:hypothetical protein
MPANLKALLIGGALAATLAACGSSSGTTPQGTTSPETTGAQASGAPGGEATTSANATGQAPSKSEEKAASNSFKPNPNESPGGIRSILEYGSAASAAEKAALGATAHSFFSAMARRDYAGVCALLSESNKKALEAFNKAKHESKSCPDLLAKLIPHALPEAKAAAAGTIHSVRVKGETAFVLFRPKGGQPSYFVLKREGNNWRAISLAPGTPLNPSP